MDGNFEYDEWGNPRGSFDEWINVRKMADAPRSDGSQQACSSGIGDMELILQEVDDTITDRNELMRIILVAMKGKVNPGIARIVIENHLLKKQQS